MIFVKKGILELEPVECPFNVNVLLFDLLLSYEPRTERLSAFERVPKSS